MSNNAHELSNRLLNALDSNYNVVDMHAVNEIISILERINITKELLETTRLGKHVNELRRKTTDQTLARRAKVLVKRWRDLVIPSVTSPGHTGSNRSSAERAVRRLGGTPLTSPALSRQVVSPVVPSSRPPSRPAWGGYESDSQDVILVDDDPPPPAGKPPPALDPLPSVKRPPSPTPLHDEKKAKRDKKPKKRRGYSRAGSGAEGGAGAGALATPALATPALATPVPGAAPAPDPGAPWPARNGAGERRRNGFRRDDRKLDPYAALVNKMPPAGAKKVKTTKELLQEIQQRAGKPASPRSPHSPDVMLIEPEPSPPMKVESPLRNGSSEPRLPSPLPAPEPEPEPWQPLEDYREHRECTCGEEEEDSQCAAREARLRSVVLPVHVRALHHAFLPGINGTRAPALPHQFAVRKIEDPAKPGLFNSVVPLYKYSDYADDYCTKNMDRVTLCAHLPWTEFAPPPPDPPPPPSPPPIRPYPVDEPEVEIKKEKEESTTESPEPEADREPVEAEMVGFPRLEPSERLKAPLLTPEDETQFGNDAKAVKRMEVEEQFSCSSPEHRTVERTKAETCGGRALYEQCSLARDAVPYDYEQLAAAPTVSLPEDPGDAEAVVSSALAEAGAETDRDALSRPVPATRFAEWHECARLGSLIALPYVVID